MRPCVSARSFELSFGNFEPLDARSLSQCSSRTPLCFISGLIAMTQPDYISNSFNVFSAVLSKFMFFFRLEDLRQRFKTPLQRLWKGTGGVQAWNRQFREQSVSQPSSSFLFAFQCRKVKDCPTMLRTLSNMHGKEIESNRAKTQV